MARRAHQISSDFISLNEENSKLLTTFEKCSYPKLKTKSILENIIGQSKQPEDIKKPLIKLPFVPQLSAKIGSFLHRFNVRVMYGKPTTIGNLLFKNSPPCPHADQRDVVYKIDCLDCSKCYIGKTTRPLNCRLKEHQKALNERNLNKSALAEHQSITAGHRFDLSNTTIIARDSQPKELVAKESYLIQKHNTFNRDKPVVNHSLVTLL